MATDTLLRAARVVVPCAHINQVKEMTVSKSRLPNKSLLKPNEGQFDYVDSFAAEFVDENDEITASAVARAFFMSGPEWVEKLFAWRNQIVGRLGLKTSGATDRLTVLNGFMGQKGEQVGLFKVFENTADEIILGEDDKHLDFRVSLFIDRTNEDQSKKKLIISTTVKMHNWFGRLYFLPVKPFHRLIVPTMLKGTIRNLDKSRSQTHCSMKQFIMICLLAYAYVASAQESTDSDLFRNLKTQDSIFFERGFNLCDMEYLKEQIAADLRFYHDQGGFQNRDAFFESVRKNICSGAQKKPVRKVEAGSLEVFPLYQNGTLYGAIQSGIHHFYLREMHQADVYTNTARFTHVWILENETWKLSEVLSYDHRQRKE